ncbi:hypothetical protein DDE18_19385 [Nocardioides gansuensis]|uniref:Uncharacterized protein n=1 Tax=Nocardioides gansuensis TaxID=2138300 RepID=A0A2T8F6J7_9ACTN|nr:hypothetical protein DDE18_19385 [Nocardioides gansuensis]
MPAADAGADADLFVDADADADPFVDADPDADPDGGDITHGGTTGSTARVRPRVHRRVQRQRRRHPQVEHLHRPPQLVIGMQRVRQPQGRRRRAHDAVRPPVLGGLRGQLVPRIDDDQAGVRGQQPVRHRPVPGGQQRPAQHARPPDHPHALALQ